MHAARLSKERSRAAFARRSEKLAALAAAALFAACIGMTVQACGDDLTVGGQLAPTAPATTTGATPTEEP